MLNQLDQLIALKKRREQAIRIEILKAQNQKKKIDAFVEEIIKKRQVLYFSWEEENKKSRLIQSKEFRLLQKDFNSFYEDTKALTSELVSLEKTKESLLQEERLLKTKLQRNLIDQEKLQYVLENPL